MKACTATKTEVRNRLEDVLTKAQRGKVVTVTDYNLPTGAAIVAASIVTGDATQADIDFLLERLLEVAPARLASDLEIAKR